MARRKSAKKKQQEKELYTYLGVVIIGAILLIACMRLGIVGIFLYNLFRVIFGEYFYVVLIYFCIMAIWHNVKRFKSSLTVTILIGTILLILALLIWAMLPYDRSLNGFSIFQSFIDNVPTYFNSQGNAFGGIVGALLLSIFTILFDYQGTMIMLVVMIIIALLLMIPISNINKIFDSGNKVIKKSKELLTTDEDDDEYEEEIVSVHKPLINTIDVDDEPLITNKKSLFIEADAEEKVEEVKAVNTAPISKIEVENKNTSVKNNAKAAPYMPAPLSLLDPLSSIKKSTKNQISAKEKGERLIEILENFGINAKLIATHIGPSVTKFEVRPDANVKVSKIQSLSDNIKMELAARDIRIEAPIPGKNAVGIEIPNVESTMVKMKELMMGIPKEQEDKPLLFALGKDLMGKNVYCQLDKMPHLLIAGQTGSGKSVCMNTIITSFLLRCSCDDVKLLLIDPKKVEFTPYHKIPHLLGPVISDPTKANNALKIVVNIMDERYDLFSQVGVRNISVYNQKVKSQNDKENGLKPLPYIVVIIDELADLMAVAGKEVELSIQRITQLARAAGIHLIVATQRPSTDVITGIIKANIPSRIAFNVSSSIDSRTIIDQSGAERLLGNGDMLYYPTGEPSPIRLQGVYVTDEEVNRICEYVNAQRTPIYDDAFIRLEGVDNNENTAVMSACDDPLYEEIKDYVVEVQKASASLLQRRFGIGYNRAARMIDVLEDKGIIGPQQGSKPREVYLKKDMENKEN